MKRRLLLGSMALAALPGLAATLQPKALLTVSGRIGQVNNKKAMSCEPPASPPVR